MGMRIFSCLIIVGVLSSGCATGTTGRAFDQSQISNLERNKTTKAEVVKLFGTPNSTTRGADGSEQLTYMYIKSTVGGLGFIVPGGGVSIKSEGQTLIIMIKNDVVTDYTYHESSQ